MWIHVQDTGILIAPDLQIESHGYSGQPPWVNDPSAQAMHGLGPCPVGTYTLGIWVNDHPRLGKMVCPLLPDDTNEMFGRSGFFLHGDSLEHPGYASDGCLIHGRAARLSIKMSFDRRLEVVRTWPSLIQA